MTVSHVHTHAETWSRTHARKVAGKIAADLLGLQQSYGEPSDYWIEQYVQELVVLLTARFVDHVTYGFKRNGDWVVGIRYEADFNGHLVVDDRSGRVPRHGDTSNSTWYSYLARSDAWWGLTQAERDVIQAQLPFRRGTADEPRIAGNCRPDKTYSSAGCGVRRSTIGEA